MTSGQRFLRLFVVAAALLGACLAAEAAEKQAKGFIDGSAFRDLASADDEVVEVNVAGAILQALGAGAGESDVGSVLRGLQSINAYIVNLRGATDRVERALKVAAGMESKLRGQGWSAIVTVRDKKSRVNVWTLAEGESVQGLVVTAIDSAEGSAVFVNITGAIDLAKLGALTSMIDVPGLESIGKGAGSKPAGGQDKPVAEPD
jgi:hypothetical protein